jgi:hypothetical protein
VVADVTQRLANIADAARYGFACVYAVRIEGIPTIFVERDLEGTAPTHYTVDGSLVVDDSAALGAEIDRREGIGRALPFTLGLLDTETVRGYFRRPAYVARLTRDMGVSNLDAVWVEHLFAGNTKLATSGTVYVGNETMLYAGQALTAGLGPSMISMTRDIYGRRYAHKAGSTSAIAASGPLAFRGRLVELFAVPVNPFGVVDQDAGGDMLSRAAAVWIGHVAGRPRREGAIWSVECTSLDRLLAEQVVSGVTASGGFQGSADSWVLVREPNASYAIFASIVGHQLVEYMAPFTSLTAGDRVRVSTLRRLLSEAWETKIVGSTDNDFGIGSLTWRWVGDELAWAGLFEWVPPTGGPHALELIVTTAGTVTGYASTGSTGEPVEGKGQPGLGVLNGLTQLDGAVSGDTYYVDTQIRGRSVVTDGTFVGSVDSGDPANLPATGSVIIKGEGGDLHRSYVDLAVTSDGAIQLDLDADALPVATEGKVTLVFAFEDRGTPATVARRMLVSTGLSLNGAFDVLPRGAGYGIAEDNVDSPSFLAAFDALFTNLVLDLSIEDAASFASVYGGLLALSQRGVVLRAAADGSAIALTAIRTGLSEGELAAGTIDRTTLAVSPDGGLSPVRARDTLIAPNVVEVRVPAKGNDNAGTITIADASAVEAEGAERWTMNVLGLARTSAVGPVEAWAVALFALAKTGQAVEFDVVPWLNVEVGDTVAVNLPEHPGVWDYATGAPGYVGPGRVIGVRRGLATGNTTLSVLLSGVFETFQLSPSALVESFDGTAGAPTAVYVDAAYLPIFTSYLETAADFDLVPYTAGIGDLSARYTVNAVALVGGDCKMTVSAVTGTYTLAVGHWVTLPPSAECVPEQLEYMHTDSDGVWS